MRKDVKRSLLFWPTATAASVALMSGLLIVQDSQPQKGSRPAGLPTMKPTFDSVASSITNVDLSSRDEHGRRAMEMPQRVARILGVPSNQADHPEQGKRGSIAGMILPPWGVVLETAAGPSNNHADIEIGDAVATSDQRSDAQHLDSPSPSSAATMLSEIIVLNRPGAHLPQSNRIYAKPDFKSQPQPAKATKQSIDPHPALSQSSTRTTSGEKVQSRVPAMRAAAWPVTSALDQQLRSLSSLAKGHRSAHRERLVSASRSAEEMGQWASEVSAALKQLQQLPGLGHADAEPLLERLEQMALVGGQQADQLRDRELQIHWLGASHAVARRVAIWQPVWKLASGNADRSSASDLAATEQGDRSHAIVSAIDLIRAELADTGDAAGWEQYLMLDQIDRAVATYDQTVRMNVAQRFLTRIERRSLHPSHQQWLGRQSIRSLKEAIGPWAYGVVDHAELLSLVEQQEIDPTDPAASRIAESMRTLRFAGNTTAADVANAIDTHYRNANARVAISQAMLQRLLPTVPTESVPVRGKVLGSYVRGASKIDSDLQVSLVPSPNQWSLQLGTAGRILTHSTGTRGSISVRTRNDANFNATTPIQVSQHGVQLGHSDAQVRGRTQLRGIRTNYDRLPLVGTVVRGVVANQFDSMAAKSNQIANRRIENEVESKIDQQLNQRIGQATDQLGKLVLGPLGRLQLDPTVTDMQTTDERLLARYRLATDGQLAAFTPRPRAMSDSLVSVQVHQSAVNNTLQQLVPSDRPTPIREAISNAVRTFGDQSIQLPNDIPSDVLVQFSKTRPMTAEFDDGLVWVTMRIVQLRRHNRLNLTKFIVRATYRPVIDGGEARLVREGHLRISGPGMSMRERLPIRAIFNKVLSPNRPLPLTTAALADHEALRGLRISQLELRDGWIALAISEASEPKVATRKQ